MDPMKEHVAVHLVDRFLAEAVSAEELDFVHRHVESCERCRARLDESRAVREAFLVRNPPAARVAQLKLAPARTAPKWPWLAAPAGIVAAALAAMLVLPSTHPPTPDVLAKGSGTAFVVYRNGAAAAAGPVETLQAGDVIQPGSAGADRYRLLIGVDSRGRVQLLAQGGPGAQLPSLTLDASLDPERVLLLSSQAPLAVANLQQRLEESFAAAHGDLASMVVTPGLLGTEASVSSLMILKKR